MSAFQMKYIIIDDGAIPLPMVFSGFQKHSDVALRMGAVKILGAGFCYIDNAGEPAFVCYGESISLNVKSRESEDSKILNKMFGIQGSY